MNNNIGQTAIYRGNKNINFPDPNFKLVEILECPKKDLVGFDCFNVIDSDKKFSDRKGNYIYPIQLNPKQLVKFGFVTSSNNLESGYKLLILENSSINMTYSQIIGYSNRQLMDTGLCKGIPELSIAKSITIDNLSDYYKVHSPVTIDDVYNQIRGILAPDISRLDFFRDMNHID